MTPRQHPSRRHLPYFFQFDDRHAPGLNNSLPGYRS